jgi:hypothetical protein
VRGLPAYGVQRRANSLGVLRQRDAGGDSSSSSLLTGLVSYWKLDETSGTRFDSVSTNNLTDNNTVGSAIGKIGNAASFVRANNEYLSSASSAFDIAANEDFAFSFWYKGTGTASPNVNEVILGKGTFNDANGGWYLNLEQSPQRFQFVFTDTSGSSLIAHGSTNYNDGFWHHIVLNFDRSGNAVVIVDGNTGTPEVALDISSRAGAVQSNFDFFLARFADNLGNNFAGKLDELGFWKGRILTDAEIAQLYNGSASITYPFS